MNHKRGDIEIILWSVGVQQPDANVSLYEVFLSLSFSFRFVKILLFVMGSHHFHVIFGRASCGTVAHHTYLLFDI